MWNRVKYFITNCNYNNFDTVQNIIITLLYKKCYSIPSHIFLITKEAEDKQTPI